MDDYERNCARSALDQLNGFQADYESGRDADAIERVYNAIAELENVLGDPPRDCPEKRKNFGREKPVPKPDWPPESDVELHGTDLLSLWQDAAREWHEYAVALEERKPPIAPDVERLAEVAHHANMGEGGGRPHPWEDQPGVYRDLMRRIVRAVLEAMVEGVD
jgi:hypothetical protein